MKICRRNRDAWSDLLQLFVLILRWDSPIIFSFDYKMCSTNLTPTVSLKSFIFHQDMNYSTTTFSSGAFFYGQNCITQHSPQEFQYFGYFLAILFLVFSIPTFPKGEFSPSIWRCSLYVKLFPRQRGSNKVNVISDLHLVAVTTEYFSVSMIF